MVADNANGVVSAEPTISKKCDQVTLRNETLLGKIEKHIYQIIL